MNPPNQNQNPKKHNLSDLRRVLESTLDGAPRIAYKKPVPSQTQVYRKPHMSGQQQPQHQHPARPNNTNKPMPPRSRSHGGFSNKPKGPPRNAQYSVPKQKLGVAKLPPVAPGDIRIIPLGGVEEIGKNMTAIETYDDIIVIDAGMQFENKNTPGVDYIIPNTTYLEERKDKIRAIIITHGHLDHIGGISLVASRIGNPPIYSRYLTTLLVQKRHTDYPSLPPLNVQVVEKNEKLTLGNMHLRFFGVTHTIPDSMGIILDTPYGDIVTPGDYKLDQIDGVVSATEEAEYKFFDSEKVLLLMTDSTNIEKEGFSFPEIRVHEGLDRLITKATGRIIIAAFASHITRLIKIVEIAERLGKKVALDGRSMKTNLDVCIQAGLFKPKPGTLIPLEDVDKYPAQKIIMLMTGGQGEEFAALSRASRKEHKKFIIKKGDTIILSASVVPGNELAVQELKDGLARQGVKIISYRTGEDFVHATGHGNQEDIKWLHKKTHPKFFIPIHGWHYSLVLHKELAMSIGMSEENIVVPDNGSLIEIRDNGNKIVVLKEKAPAAPMVVDGLSVSDEQGVVLRDRRMLADDGMFIVIAAVNAQGKLLKSPDLISRGFVYMKENQELLRSARMLVKKTIEERARGKETDFEQMKDVVAETVSKFLFQKTAKSPLVIPVILSV